MDTRFLLKSSLAAACIFLFTATTAQPHESTCASGDKTEFNDIKLSRNDFVKNYAAGNVDGIVAAYDDYATFAGTLQPFWLEGKSEVEDLWGRFFGAWSQRKLVFRQPTVCFYGDTAIETGHMEMYMGDPPDKPMVTTFIRYSIARIKRDGGWKIVNMHVSRLP